MITSDTPAEELVKMYDNEHKMAATVDGVTAELIAMLSSKTDIPTHILAGKAMFYGMKQLVIEIKQMQTELNGAENE